MTAIRSVGRRDVVRIFDSNGSLLVLLLAPQALTVLEALFGQVFP